MDPHTFAVTQFRPAGFIASPLDAGLLRQRCSAAYYLPSGTGAPPHHMIQKNKSGKGNRSPYNAFRISLEQYNKFVI